MASHRLPVWISLLLWAAWSSTVFVNAQSEPVDLRALLTDAVQSWSAGTTLVFPDSPEFTETTERWTIFRPPTYSATVRPGTEGDIPKIVQLATSHNIPLLARGAGHSYTTTLGDFQNGLNIDLNHFKTVAVNKSAKTVTIGPGVTGADIFDPVYAAGFEIQTGSCSCPSLIGVTLGGGVGRFQGHHGLMIDAVESLRVVTAKGELITVSTKSNSDLFWGMRGAGANFGIVTSATYKLKPLTNRGNFFNIEFTFDRNTAPAYFKAVETYNKDLPAKVASVTFLQYNTTINETQVRAGWTYFGTEKEGRRVLAPIIGLGVQPTAQYMVPWNRLTATAGEGMDVLVCQGDIIRDLYNLNIKQYSAATYVSTFKKMEKFFAAYPGGRNSVITYEFFPNQAMLAVPSAETAFKWRDSKGYINPTFIWAPGDEVTAQAGSKLGKELRQDFAATSGYGKHVVFLNYAHGDEKLEDIYGKDKLPRLAGLKKKWDPNHVFSYNNRLPTAYP